MKRRTAVPESTANALLVANRRACCICHEPKQVIIHHIDGDPSNHEPENLAVLCLDCHGRVTGDEGLGRRYTDAEVRAHKQGWEEMCADSTFEATEDGADESIPVLYETALLCSQDEFAYEIPLEEGEELFASVSATGYCDVMICDSDNYDEWCKGEDIDVYDDAEGIRRKEFTFQAPEGGIYLLVVSNFSDDDIDVTVKATVAGPEDED